MNLADKVIAKYLKKTGTKLDAGKNPLDVKAAFWILKHFIPLRRETDGKVLPENGEKILDRILETTNGAFTDDGCIGSQRELAYVPFAKEGNTADHGCGWISVYNALKLLGTEEEPEMLLREMAYGARKKGKGGVNPFYVYRWLKRKGFRTNIVTGMERMDREGKKVPVFILCYLYLSDSGKVGGHFAAGCWEDGFRIYNGEKPGRVTYERIEDAFSSGTVFKMMITIEKTEDC